MHPEQSVEEAYSRSLLVNNYFSKNRDKFTYNKESQEKYQGKYIFFLILVFDQIDDDFEEQKLKLKYMDSFITRYVYHNTARWFERLQLVLGIKKE